MPNPIRRRTFLEFLGKGTMGAAISATPFTQLAGATQSARAFEIKGIKPSDKDLLKLAKGLDFDILIKWGDAISDKDTFGFNNDFTAFLPLDESNEDGLLWVNHEYIDPYFIAAEHQVTERDLEQIKREQYNVGGTFVRIQKNKKGKWKVVKNDPQNRRISGLTEIPFNWEQPIADKKSAIGTLANCSGGVTPWGTILTCEENYDQFYGERNFKTGEIELNRYDQGWTEFVDYPPEHYGWVVEVDPNTGEAQKHIALGRCAHECATVKELPDGRLVVYTGDDAINQCLYKFVSDKPGSLSEGTLYVANLTIGKWTPLKYEDSEVLQKFFKDQTEVLIRLREAAKYVGGTPLLIVLRTSKLIL